MKLVLFDAKIYKDGIILLSDASSSSKKEKLSAERNFAAFTFSLKFHVRKTVRYFKPLGFYAPDLTFSHAKKCSLEIFDYIETSSFPLSSSCEWAAPSFTRRKAPAPPEDLQLQNRFNALAAVKGLGGLSNESSVFSKPEPCSSTRGKWQVLARDGGPSSSD